ncbi:MAG: cyclic nucleotide-binding domain-containing protein [Planctomycetota bacterium]|nr:cyclic nucleotide-binding domain-containing protein [Planctomycetota bacterium]
MVQQVQGQAASLFLAAPFLSDFDEDLRLGVFEALAPERAHAGATLLEQGRPNDQLSFVIEGTAIIERIFPGGHIEHVATLNAPAVFGSTSFFRAVPPSVRVRAQTNVWLLKLTHPAHEALRRDNPRAAEALALAAVRVLSERFDMLDRRVVEFLRQQPVDHAKDNEWSNFRARLFEDSSL